MTSSEEKSINNIIRVGYEKDLPVGDYNAVEADGREILLVHLDTIIYALQNNCIHGGCRIAQGKFDGVTLRCLCHGSVFDVRTGAVLNGPATVPQPLYKVIVEKGEISRHLIVDTSFPSSTEYPRPDS